MEIAPRSCQDSSALLSVRMRVPGLVGTVTFEGRPRAGFICTFSRRSHRAEDNAVAVAGPRTFNHRYPEPLDEPPPDAEPIPPELPFPEPPQPDQIPGQAPVRVSGRYDMAAARQVQ